MRILDLMEDFKRGAYVSMQDRMEIYTFVTKLVSLTDYGKTMVNENDGFVGTIVGAYLTREEEPGIVLQQMDTRVVHVYRAKWLKEPT